MAVAPKGTPPSQPDFTIDLKGKKVLIVEDFFSFRNTIKKMVQSFGLTDIDEASDGKEAITKLSQTKYDIILCDYNLGPGKDGQQVLEEARHREYIDYSTVFIMATAENTMNMFMGAIEYEPDDYMVKPFTKETLERKLKDWVNKKENLKDIERAFAKKDYEKVIALCDEFISDNPKNLAQLFKLKGEALIRKGDYDKAAAFYEKVLTMGNMPWAILNLGKIRYIIGDYEEAKAIFEGLIAENDKIVSAHDWLAKVHEKTGNTQEAQKILQNAIRISPKAILRQKALGDIAYKNKDLSVAEQSFKEAVKQGKHSFFKSASDYTSLAKVLLDKNEPQEGLSVLSEAGREFSDSTEASLQISITEVLTLKKLNREEDAKKALDKVSKLAAKLPGKMSTDVELDLAKALISSGDEKTGNAIIRRLVQSNHEDLELIATVQDVYKDLNIGDKGKQIIALAREEVVTLNNNGVRLVKEGKFSDAIELFEKAVDSLPDNKIINANAAQALIVYMKKKGRDADLLQKAKECLDRVKALDPAYKNLNTLLTAYKGLAQER
jgi:tetratricopeptide (TPR) repeat protein